jgi:hypothetical protein
MGSLAASILTNEKTTGQSDPRSQARLAIRQVCAAVLILSANLSPASAIVTSG